MCIPILQLRYSLISHPFSTIHTHRSFGGCMQLFFLTSVYAYVLFFAANLISDGSELLLLVRIVSHTLFPLATASLPAHPISCSPLPAPLPRRTAPHILWATRTPIASLRPR